MIQLHKARQRGGQLGALQLDDQFTGRLKSIARMAGHHAGQYAVQERRDLRVDHVSRNEVSFQLPFGNFARAVSLERHFAGQQVIKRRSESVNITAAVRALGTDRLLVGHVIGSAEALVSGGELAGIIHALGQTQIR